MTTVTNELSKVKELFTDDMFEIDKEYNLLSIRCKKVTALKEDDEFEVHRYTIYSEYDVNTDKYYVSYKMVREYKKFHNEGYNSYDEDMGCNVYNYFEDVAFCNIDSVTDFIQSNILSHLNTMMRYYRYDH